MVTGKPVSLSVVTAYRYYLTGEAYDAFIDYPIKLGGMCDGLKV